MQLRPYQQEAKDAVLREFETKDSTIIVIPTGGGKTVIAANIVEEFLRQYGGHCLFLAHREELLGQTQEKMESVGLTTGLEKAEAFVNRSQLPDVTTASVQSLSREKRLRSFSPHAFSLMVSDECFPAGTLIDNKPIESLKVGDRIWSYNHKTNRREIRQIRRVFVSRPTQLVAVQLKNGGKLVCTPGHPFFTGSGYTPAINLPHGQMLFTQEKKNEDSSVRHLPVTLHPQIMEQHNDPIVLIGMQEGQAKCKTNEGRRPLLTMQNPCPPYWRKEDPLRENGQGLLFGNMQKGISETPFLNNNGANKPQVRIIPDDREKSNETLFSQGEGFHLIENHRSQTQVSRGEWDWPNQTSTGSLFCPGASMEEGTSSEDWCKERQRIPISLQNRSWPQGIYDCYRNRREQPLRTSQKGTGHQEGGFSTGEQVDSVTFLEQTSDGTFGGMCPDGFVYNVEVEGNHNYYANGILVHNCHHSTATSYLTIYKYFQNVKHLGLTATPDRSDRQALGKVFQSVAYAYDIRDAIEQGYLVRIRSQQVVVDSLDLSKVRTVAGDYVDTDLEQQFMAEQSLHEVAQPILAVSEDRPTLIFSPGVHHAHELSRVLNGYRPGSAEAIDGSMNGEQRRDILNRFRAGAFQYLANMGILTEGVDIPQIACVANCRPTKSRSLYSQIVGRALRLYRSKDHALILDFTDAASRHTLISPFDIMDGSMDEETKKRAQEISRKNPHFDTLKAIALADEELAEEKRRRLLREQEQRQRLMETKATYRTVDIDPFTILGVNLRPGRWADIPMTDKQRALIEKYKLPTQGLDKGTASQVIDKIISRSREGLCTPKMAQTLAKFGLNPDVPFEVAKKQLDTIARWSWRPPVEIQEQLRQMAA